MNGLFNASESLDQLSFSGLPQHCLNFLPLPQGQGSLRLSFIINASYHRANAASGLSGQGSFHQRLGQGKLGLLVGLQADFQLITEGY